LWQPEQANTQFVLKIFACLRERMNWASQQTEMNCFSRQWVYEGKYDTIPGISSQYLLLGCGVYVLLSMLASSDPLLRVGKSRAPCLNGRQEMNVLSLLCVCLSSSPGPMPGKI
jgi:hypothetical protein